MPFLFKHFFFYFWKEVFQIKNVTAKWETKIVHLLQIISPFFLPQNRAWRTKSVNSPQTVLSKTKQCSHWHSSSFLLPFSLFSLHFFPSLPCFCAHHYTLLLGRALREVPAHEEVHETPQQSAATGHLRWLYFLWSAWIFDSLSPSPSP